jgi:hypothetical protein
VLFVLGEESHGAFIEILDSVSRKLGQLHWVGDLTIKLCTSLKNSPLSVTSFQDSLVMKRIIDTQNLLNSKERIIDLSDVETFFR